MTNIVTEVELVQRLRNVDVSWSQVGEDCAAAADFIEQLVATNKRLEAALREMIGIAETLYGKTIIARGQYVSVREAVFRSEDALKSQSDEFAKQKGANHE